MSSKKNKKGSGKQEKVSLKQVKKGQKQARKETKKDTSASDVAELCAAFEGVRLDDKAGPEQRLTKRQQKR